MKNKPVDLILLKKQHCQMLMDAELTDQQLGSFCKALLCYQDEGKLPEDIDPVSLAFWKAIRADMKREFGEGIR